MLKNKSYLFCILFILLNFNLNAQIKDSILKVIYTTQNDSIKIASYEKLIGLTIYDGNLNKADSLLNNLINLKVKTFIKYKQLVCMALSAYLNELKGNYSKALKLYLNALKIAEDLKYTSHIVSINSNIGVVYFTQNEFNKSLHYYFNAIKVVKDSKVSINLGNFYSNIGNVYYKKKELEKAKGYYLQALKHYKTQNKLTGIASAKNNLGSVCLELNKFEEALGYFNEAIVSQIKLNDNFGVVYSYLNIGTAYSGLNKFNKAEENLFLGLNKAKEINFPDALRDAYISLANLYERRKMYDKAYVYYKLFISYRDSLTNSEVLKEINQNEMKFEILKKELVHKTEKERQKKEYDENQKRNRIIIYAILAILATIILFSFILYNKFKIIQKQKDLIEEKQNEIISSIRYAKRIQNAILPSFKFIKTKINSIK